MEVRTFPVGDDAFRDEVTRAVSEVMRSSAARGDATEAAAAIVRRTYRNVVITARAPIGGLNETPVWYAFRDKRVRPRDPNRERLYASLSSARDAARKADDLMEKSLDTAKRAGF